MPTVPYDFMKPLRAWLCLICLTLLTEAYAQSQTDSSSSTVEDTTNEATSPTIPPQKAVTNPIEKLSTYLPSHQALRNTDPEIEKKDYERIQLGVRQLEDEFLRHVLLQIEPMARDISNRTRRQNAYKTILFNLTPNYYNSLSKAANRNYHVQKSTQMLDMAMRRFVDIEPSLPYHGYSEKEIKQMLYQLKKTRGILKFFKGSSRGMQDAVKDFEYLIGHNPGQVIYSQSDEELRTIYQYLASANRLLYEDNRMHDYLAIHYLQRELLYLCRITLLNTKDNEPLRDYKIKKLLESYVTVIDIHSDEYKVYYKNYMDDALLEKIPTYHTVKTLPVPADENKSREGDEPIPSTSDSEGNTPEANTPNNAEDQQETTEPNDP